MEKVIKLAEKIIEVMNETDAEPFEVNLAYDLVPIMRTWRGTKNFLNQEAGIAVEVRDFGFAPTSQSEPQHS